jgi:hypothetical protein
VVRWRLSVLLAAVGLVAACGKERDMPAADEPPDSMEVIRALGDRTVGDSLMDVMPGGEMARGDTAATRRLLERKR